MSATLIPTSSEAEWLDARRQGITASEIAVVMGLSPYSSPYALYHGKLGNLPEQEDKDAMERGRILEPYIAGKFARQHLEFFVTGDGRQLYAHPDRPWQLATPDRLLRGGLSVGMEPIAVLETKTDGGSDEWGDEGTDEIPVHYRCQVLWQMDVMGVTTAFVACLFIQPWKVRTYELTMDAAARADLKLMREEARCFLDRIDLGDEPDVDWRPATAAALKQLHPDLDDTEITVNRTLAMQYRSACRAVKKAEKRKALAENRLRARLGTGRRVLDPDGQVIARREVYELPAKTIERKAATVNRLVAVKPKEHSA